MSNENTPRTMEEAARAVLESAAPGRHRRAVGLGWTEEGYRVVAEISLELPTRETVQYIDHTTGPAPVRFSVSFNVKDMRRPANGYDAWGQISAADRVIARRAVAGVDGSNYSDAPPELERWISAAWERWHLNDMHAECAHMAEQLNPAPEILDTYAAEHPEAARYGAQQVLSHWRMDSVTCPESGYRYGREWLAETLPDHIIATALNILSAGAAAEIVEG